MPKKHQQIMQLLLELSRSYGLWTSGEHLGTRTGNGLEIAGVRPAEFGDPARWINPRATARTLPRTLMVSPRQVEHDLHVTIVIDLQARANWGGPKALSSKAACLQHLGKDIVSDLNRRGDKFSVILLAETVLTVPMAGGPEHCRRTTGRIMSAVPGGESQLAAQLDALARSRKRTELFIVLSDLQTLGWEEPLKRLSRGGHREVLVVQVQDMWDRALPNVGPLKVVNPHTGRKDILHTEKPTIRERYGIAVAERQAKVEQGVQRAKVRHILFDTGQHLNEQFNPHTRLRRRRTARGSRGARK